MKKVAFGAIVLLVGLAALTGLTPAYAAQTSLASNMSPEQAAAMKQKLEAMQSQLLTLQSQYAAKVAAETAQAAPAKSSIALNAQDKTALYQSLEALKGALVQLQSRVGSTELTAEKRQILSASLAGIVKSLAVLNSSLKKSTVAASAMVSSPKVAAMPQKTAVAKPAPAKPVIGESESQNNPVMSETNESQTAVANPSDENQTANETAQSGGTLNLKKPQWFVIGGLVIIALIWFWVARSRGKKTAKIKPAEQYVEGAQRESA